MRRAKIIALIAGFGFFFLALVVQGIFPYLMRETRIKTVTKTVRTSLGELTEIKADAVPYSELLARGRKIYMREGCWYCHSMYLRPVTGENRRWGPVSEFGEYAYDLPHLIGTRRIGPDLSRIGGKVGDDWHSAHFFDPRAVVPDSVMPRFEWFFKNETADGKRVLSEDGIAVTAFVQNIGMNKGRWRDGFSYQILQEGSSSIETPASLEHGKAVYERRCIGCHGEKGDGKGPAPSTVVFEIAQPRDFTSGVFKFRTTPTGSLPLDSDIFRTISVGVRGTAMPPWFNLPEDDRRDVIHFIKTFSSDFVNYPPEPPILIPQAPKPTAELIAHGKQVFKDMKCWECHGNEGKGDGPKSDTLKDDFGDRIPPANFTRGTFKSGPRPEDIFRTFMTGLSGTPMPSFSDSFTSPDDGWALTFFVLSLSEDAKQ
ncbi:MAG: cbb3-type cytochrome c oxidase subunit II [bacterium]